jgi:PAS domain S-box-containing protein
MTKPINLSGAEPDISGRMRSNDAPRTHEAQFRLLTDAMPHIVWMMLPDGRDTYFNPQWTAYTGLLLDESLDNNRARLIHPDDSLRAAQLWEQASGSGEIYQIECRLRRADGVYRWMLGRAVPLCDAAGQRTQWLGTYTDINDLKQATVLLEKDHAMIRIAGRVARLGGWSIDLPERTLTWSAENCLIHDVAPGYQPTLEEGIGYFLPEHRPTVIAYVEACTRQGTPYEFELPKFTATGRRIWVRSIGEAVRDDAGKIIRIQGAFQDITQIRADQAQLRLLETAVSRLNDIVIITESAPFDEQGPRIVFVNDAFERYTGYRREDAIGNTPLFLLGPSSQRPELERIRAAMQKWLPVRSEMISYTKAGRELWLEIDIAPIADESGIFTHWLAVGRDITERRRQQEEILRLNSELEERVLLRTAQLESAMLELEGFSYSVAHDLRSPLNSIDGFSALLQKTLPSDSGEQAQHYLARIRNGAKRMGELTDGLLSLAQLSRTRLIWSTVDMSAEASTVIQKYLESDAMRVVQVTIEPGLLVWADRSLLRLVLENLIANAWKFTSKKPNAEISVGRETGADHQPLYFVRDNGAGFDMAYADKLFGNFQRLHSPDEFSGSGIGLATVKRIIGRHGGKIWASSAVDQGSTFYFTLGSKDAKAVPRGADRIYVKPSSLGE